MRQNYRGRVDRQRLLNKLPRIDAGAVNRATKQFLELEHPVPVIELCGDQHNSIYV